MSARATGGVSGPVDPEDTELEGDVPVDDEVDPFDEDEDPESDLEEDLEEDLDDEDADEEEDAEQGLDELAAGDDADNEEEEPGVTVVPPDAEFDDDAPVPVVDEEAEEEIEGLRDGEFVCRGCFMAKRETQLADADALLCRDCA